MGTYEQLVARLRPFGQEHLVAFWDELDEGERESLARQIEGIDFSQVAKLFGCRGSGGDLAAMAERAAEPPAIRLGDRQNRFSPEEARRRGSEALRGGKVAVLLVAGGQGSRLGFEHPKGMYRIGPVSGCSIFQIHLEKVIGTARRYGAPVPLYVMVSPATDQETREFFAAHGRFGLDESDFRIFCQGTMPAVDHASGKVLLAERGQIALSPDGHGGTLAALESSGALAEMAERGIEQIFYFQVDNPLVDVCSPELLGYHLLAGSELTSEVVAKKSPKDRVGNVVEVDGRLHVIEYSDLADEFAERRREDGSLVIWAGSIAVHVFDVAFLRRMVGKADALPFHIAHKKVAFVDSRGEVQKPAEPNAYKFERFIFDLLPEADNGLVVEVDPRLHFAPLKNASGAAEDTPEAVRAQMIAIHTDWLKRAGADVAEGTPVEISPLVALDAEELAGKIERGLKIREATYLRA
ncbi:MAG: UTP--glucose-1-phosphate uridylyltransferase [Thermoguttaceae bacterium]